MAFSIFQKIQFAKICDAKTVLCGIGLSLIATLATGCGKIALDFNRGGTIPRNSVSSGNRALGNSAFSAISTGESAYGRVSSGPAVSMKGLFGSWAPGSSSANRVASANAPSAATDPKAPWNRKLPVAFQSPGNQNQANTGQGTSPNIQNRQPAGISQNPAGLAQSQVNNLQDNLKKLQSDNFQLRNQLKATTDQLADAQAKIQSTGEQLKVMTASSRSQGFQGATIRANNSLLAGIQHLKIPGFRVEPDGDLIRMSVASDLVFQPGTYQVQPGAGQLFQQAAAAIAQHYPRQIIGIESHWDNSTVGASQTTGHQVTTGQALSVLEYLSGQARLPSQQFLVVGMGGNRPKFANTTPQGKAANRRIELVIYPEQF